MQKPQNKWPDTAKARSLLFFAESVQQLSSIETFESFRMMTLDSVSRIKEAKVLISDIQKGLPKQSFSPVAKEIVWTLKNDPVIEVSKFDQVSVALKIIDSTQFNDKTDMARLNSRLDVVLSLLSDGYKANIEQFILNNYTNEQKRSSVLVAISYYLSYLVNNGYSRQHIYDAVEEVFFLEDIGRATNARIRSFFAYFDMRDERFDVYFQADGSSVAYLKDVYPCVVAEEHSIPAEINAAYALSGADLDPSKQFVFVERRAKDMFAAAHQVSSELGSIVSVTVLSAWSFHLPAPRDFAVLFKRKKIARGYKIDLIAGSASVKIAESLARGTKDSKSDVRNIAKKFDDRSVERIHSSISTVSASLEHSSYDSRLISIWSSFEALLSSPPQGSVRILHYVDAISPCVLSRYCERNVVSVYNALILASRTEFVKRLDVVAEAGESNRILQFMSLILDDQFSNELKGLSALYSGYPLLSHRLESVRRKFSDPSAYLSAVAAHKDRVDWQLHRIYRARNQLVHSGRAPAYLEMLTVNAFEYYRNAIKHIIGHAAKLGGRNDIDAVVESVDLRYQSHLAYVTSLQASKKFTMSSIRKAFLI